MAFRSRSSVPSRGRSQRRKTVWSVGPNAVAVAFSATGSAIWPIGVAPTTPGLTHIRLRGSAVARLTAAGGIGNGFTGAIGVGVATASAFTVGVTALPTPLTDDFWDGWLWHMYFQILAVTATVSDGVNAVANVLRVEIDSKAMRKIPDAEFVTFGAIEVIEVGTSTMAFDARTRSLVKLP